MRFRLRTLLIVLALGPIPVCSYHSAHGDTPNGSAIAEGAERISVRLLGPAEEITGIVVPKDLQGRSDTYLRRENPADVTVRLPGELAVQMRVKYVSINVDHGIAVDVHLLPQAEAVIFRVAVADLKRLMREIGIRPDQRMQSQMDAWPDNSRDFTFRTETKVNDSVTLLVKIHPNDDGRYFLALTFAADGPVRRKVADGRYTPPPSDKPTDNRQ